MIRTERNSKYGDDHHERTMRDIRAAQAGDIEARNRVVVENIGIVRRAIERVIFHKPQLCVDDFLAIGVEAMIRCIELFDTERGLRFSTLTTLSISQRVRREMNTRMTAIKIPSAVFYPRNVHDPLKAGKRRVAQRIGSIDAPCRDTGRPRVLIARNRPIHADALHAEEIASLRLAIAALPEREHEVIKSRMNGETLQAIGKRIGITRERVRQIETQALRKIADVMGGQSPETWGEVLA